MTDLQLQLEEEAENSAAPSEIKKDQGRERGRRCLPNLPRLPSPAAIDRSAWVSGACYFLALLMALKRQSTMADELKGFGIGLWILAFGVALFFIAAISIQRYMRVELSATTFGHPTQLISTGPFSVSRNPVYLAFIVPLACFIYFSIFAAFVSITAYVVAMTFYVVKPEEKGLAAEFGEEYRIFGRERRFEGRLQPRT